MPGATPLKRQTPFKKITKCFKNVTKDPELYLSVQPTKCEEIKKLLKDVYDLTIITNETVGTTSVDFLPELVLDDLDEEQIWQQVELRNEAIWPGLIESTSKFLSMRDEKFVIPIKLDEDELDNEEQEEMDLDEGDEEEEVDDEDDDDIGEEEESEDEDIFKKPSAASQIKKVKIKPSIVDDSFFKLSEMEAFLNAEDEKENRRLDGKDVDDGEQIDYFDENLSDEEEQNAEYRDFFDEEEELEAKKKKNKQVARKIDDGQDSDGDDDEEDFGDEEADEFESDDEADKEGGKLTQSGLTDNYLCEASDSDDEDHSDEKNAEEDDKPKSSFEMRQDRLHQRIQQYEEAVLGEKPWQLTGEIASVARPQNSLLEEILEFDSTSRPAPVITEETTLRLEDIIRQRIKDSAWDDVERKIKPLNTPQEYRKKLVLDQEKSKESLAQIYEKEYRKEIDKLNPNAGEATAEEPKAHKEIKSLMRELFVKLDALSNFHFTPKPVAPEAKIITNTPAVSMEEVAPLAVSDAQLLAPEEIRHHAKGAIIGKGERNKTDKNRERRQKKLRQKAIHKAHDEKDLQKQKLGIQLSKKEEQAKLLKNVTKNRNVEKMNVSANTGSFKSSKAFFTQLQDKTSTTGGKKVKTNKTQTSAISAKKLKL